MTTAQFATDYFYADLPVITDFIDITDERNFTVAPLDWWIVVTDVVGSTAAIAAGRYKEINLLGACSIVALLNVAGGLEIPFVFGGDGATAIIPPSLKEATASALLATKQLAQREFGLDLRVGLVPVAVVIQAGFGVEVAKLQIDANYHQAVFMGGGLTHATDLVKHPQFGDRYAVPPTFSEPKADFSGLECRWQDIPSPYGETVSLLVLATTRRAEANALYRAVIQQIRSTYGDDAGLHPIHPKKLRLAFRNRFLLPETKVRAASQGWFVRWRYLWRIKLENLLGCLLMHFKPTIGALDWGKFRNIISGATDYRKFDDMLRMVIAGTAEQRAQFTTYLEQQYQAGNLVYGLHVTDRALLTCVVFERHGRQVHFVDGADGGYALAAKDLKHRLQIRAKQPQVPQGWRDRFKQAESLAPDLFPDRAQSNHAASFPEVSLPPDSRALPL
jgi:hypothetical protein